MKTAFQVLGLFACLATALSVVAEESPCAESYRKASAVYSKRLSELQKKQSNSEINTAGGAGATVIGCGLLLLKRNVAMFATCVGLGASATTIAYASGSGLDEEIAKLEIDHLIY
ncbi:MAG TPA: hypothetical protein PKC28_13575, partial [Bdellovibrionales bacterium]|nr:hypothetical protein [Bdellovibrionales bacterium]